MTSKSDSIVTYDDGRIVITATDIRTPKIYYPIIETSGRVRRDGLWFALSYTVICGVALTIYHDLFHRQEIAVLAISMVIALISGSSLSALQLDARGFPPMMIFGSTRRVRKIFQAISHARSHTAIAGNRPCLSDEIQTTE